MKRQKGLHRATAMNRMPIPDQNQWTEQVMQQMPEILDDVFTPNGLTMGLQMQLDLPSRGTHTQPTNQVQTHIVFETRMLGRRLPARGPGALEGRY
jgi:hypothetical protein